MDNEKLMKRDKSLTHNIVYIVEIFHVLGNILTCL